MFRIAILLHIVFFCVGITYAQQKSIPLKRVESWYKDDSSQTKLKAVYHVRENNPEILEGGYMSFFFNGRLSSEGQYKNNTPVGEWKYYYESGRLKNVGYLDAFSDNPELSYWVYYYENGLKKQEGRLLNGQKEDEWIFYYENGTKKFTGQYKDGLKEGDWVYFYEDGSLKAEADYVAGNGKYTEYFLNGIVKMEGNTVNNESDGEWKYYYEDGTLKAKGVETNGLKNGKWEYYHTNGNVSSEGHYVNGVQQGEWKYYYEDGVINTEGIHEEGLKEGNWKVYHTNGAFKGEVNFEGGDGVYKEYYESGILKIEGRIEKDIYQGAWKYFYEEGVLEGECNYKDGFGTYRGYFKNGKIKVQGDLYNGNKIGVWKLYDESGKMVGFYKTLYDESDNNVMIDDSLQLVANKVDTLKNEPDVQLPNYKYKPQRKYAIDNLNPRVNEFKAFIISANPLGIINNTIPVSMEYYIQERLGYIITYSLIRNPYFTRRTRISDGLLYNRGYTIELGQRLYARNNDYGMLYIGHELRYKRMTYYVNEQQNGSLIVAQHSIQESAFEYLLLAGDRILKNPKKYGPTFDIFVGLGIGVRQFPYLYPKEDPVSRYFRPINTSKVYIPAIFGFSFGYLF